MVLPFYRPTVVEIDLDALTHNIQFFKERVGNKVELIAVVKADAYGHGAIPVVKHLQSIGIHYYAVAFIDEALQLRKNGILDHILVLGDTPKEGIEEAIKNDIAVTVFSKETLEDVDLIGEVLRKKLKVHIKIDTGMGRIGIFPEDSYAFFHYLQHLKWVEIEGIYTHFATADEKDKTLTDKQHQQFREVLNLITPVKDIPFIHISNSAALIDLPALKQNMARLGIGMYGLLPSQDVDPDARKLKPVMTVKTKISYLKKIKPGQSVSYGATYMATRDTIVATLPIGYADGLSRGLSNKGNVLIHGKKAPIIGRVCMDQTMVDVTHIPQVKVNDEAVIFGKQEEIDLSIDENAAILDTINYELVTLISKRLPRIYKKDGETILTINNLLT